MTNIILILTDQLRYDGLGCTGNLHVKTPNLDRLAAEGANFQQHFTPCQICSPSRASLYSGQYARQHGLHRNGVALREDVELIPHMLSKHGYTTYGVGKFHFQPILAPAEQKMPESTPFWQNPANQQWRGPYYGFETVDLVIGESFASTRSGHYAQWLRDNHPESLPLYEGEHALDGPVPTDLPEVWQAAIPAEHHYNHWIADRACDFLAQQEDDHPFFMVVSFPDPHHPFTAPRPYCDHYDPGDMPLPRHVDGELDKMPSYIKENANFVVEEAPAGYQFEYAAYLANPVVPVEQGGLTTTDTLSESTLRRAIANTNGMVEMIDFEVGRILGALEQQGLSENTLIIFTSDHGELLGDHGLIHKGPPPYRQLLQVPMLICGPGVAAGATVTGLTSHLDLKATLADYLNIESHPESGRSICPMFEDSTRQIHSTLFAEYHTRAVTSQYNQTIITDTWRLTRYPLATDPRCGELFDRQRDPHEHNNLYNDPAYEEERERLLHQLTTSFPPQSIVDSEILSIW